MFPRVDRCGTSCRFLLPVPPQPVCQGGGQWSPWVGGFLRGLNPPLTPANGIPELTRTKSSTKHPPSPSGWSWLLCRPSPWRLLRWQRTFFSSVAVSRLLLPAPRSLSHRWYPEVGTFKVCYVFLRTREVEAPLDLEIRPSYPIGRASTRSSHLIGSAIYSSFTDWLRTYR